MTKIIY